MGNTCGLSRGSRGTALISHPGQKRSRDVLSLAPFRRSPSPGVASHASPTLALYIYATLMQQKGFLQWSQSLQKDKNNAPGHGG